MVFGLLVLGMPKYAWGQLLPDLVIVTDPVGPVQVLGGQNDTVTVVVRNVGSTVISASFDLTVYLSPDSTGEASEKVGDTAVTGGLFPGVNRTVKVPIRVSALQSLGRYLWVVRADVANGIAETDETNNDRVGNGVQVVTPPPDLSFVTNPAGPNSSGLGETHSVTLAIQNLGQGATSGGVDVTLYLSSDMAFDGSDTQVGSLSFPGLLFSGNSQALTVFASVPNNQTPGTYYWLGVVDASGTESESDENNNVGVGNTVDVVQKLADFLITSPPTGPNGVFREGSYTVSLEIQNRGTDPNGSGFDVVVYLSEDLTVGNADDVFVGDVAISEVIQVGDRRTVNVPVKISALQAYLAYYWVARVDVGGAVPEVDENNNHLIGNQVSVVPSPSDLTVTTGVSGISELVRNELYTVSVTVLNQGAGSTNGAFQISIFLSADAISGNEDDIRVGGTTVTDVMAAGTSQTKEIKVTAPSVMAAEGYYWVTVADAIGVEAEADESNNALISETQTPIQLLPDLVIASELTAPGIVSRGGLYTASTLVQNAGRGDAKTDFQVAVFLSTNQLVGDEDDVQVGSVTVTDVVVSGSTLLVEIPVSISATQPVGTYRWAVRILTGGLKEELDETNNDRLGGVVSFPALSVFAESLAMGEVPVGETSTRTFQVANTGTADLNFSVSSSDNRIQVSPHSVENLPPGKSWTVTVTFLPTVGGSVLADVAIAGNDLEGKRIVRVNALGIALMKDRVFLDFDPAQGNQGVTTSRGYPYQEVPIELHVASLPEVREVTIQLAFDSLRVAYVPQSWRAGTLLPDGFPTKAELIQPGLLEVQVGGIVPGSGDGLLGRLKFQVQAALLDSTGESGPRAIWQAKKMTFTLADGTQDTLHLVAEGILVYDLICWADVDLNGRVGLGDFLFFLDAFQKNQASLGWEVPLADKPVLQTPYKRYDANVDGIINLADFILFTRVFGQTCE
ncbi:MAG: choice-of-anchor D domain-containing protein [bacterium]|nr:choice-of-anchor D domain-containing protein [bacterium]